MHTEVSGLFLKLSLLRVMAMKVGPLSDPIVRGEAKSGDQLLEELLRCHLSIFSLGEEHSTYPEKVSIKLTSTSILPWLAGFQ